MQVLREHGTPRGYHDMSCTSGGDITHRHNAVRYLLYKWAKTAHTNPDIERTGLLANPGIQLEMRRPAYVLAHLARQGDADDPIDLDAVETVAVDVTVINVRGRDHRTVLTSP